MSTNAHSSSVGSGLGIVTGLILVLVVSGFWMSKKRLRGRVLGVRNFIPSGSNGSICSAHINDAQTLEMLVRRFRAIKTEEIVSSLVLLGRLSTDYRHKFELTHAMLDVATRFVGEQCTIQARVRTLFDQIKVIVQKLNSQQMVCINDIEDWIREENRLLNEISELLKPKDITIRL